MADLELLRKERREIAELTRLHVQSVEAFRAEGKSWFKRQLDEPDSPASVRHKTTTATCLESLADAPKTNVDVHKRARNWADDFAQHALSEEWNKWASDGAAYVYCRVRALPLILRLASDETVSRFRVEITKHARYVWENVSAEPRHQAIYERPSKKPDPDDPQTSYPPNAFQTAWALTLLDLCGRRTGLRRIPRDLDARRHIALLWTQGMLGSQVALHDARSERADPNQLIWALIAQYADLTAPAEPAAGEFARRDLYRAVLEAFFKQQLPGGAWPLGQPLFHYPAAGNAYCYTFETLAALLRPALHVTAGVELRELLRPYLPNLLRAWHYARDTQMPLRDGITVGWRSGHHAHRVKAEGWATASVFSYLQCLRRLVGIWTRDEAAADLEVGPAPYESPDIAASDLEQRGETWTGGHRWSAGEQLASMFLHPVAAAATGDPQVDPDLPLIDKDQARSAILFGPPGTSKTTLVRALAGAIGWDYVEIHASDFLRRGMENVPSRADEIFLRLMELDHCVILFDEIDELLRERQDVESDPFGRFLTTSMLPKVAQLWEQRRVLFFVATNDIRHADRAIKRSQRFDAAIFVAPPAYTVKKDELSRRVPNLDLGKCTEVAVNRALGLDPSNDSRGYFALLRHDQIRELADKILQEPDNQPLALQDALRNMGSQLSASDWQFGADLVAPDGSPIRNAYEAFLYQQSQERRDFSKIRLVSVKGGSFKRAPAEVDFHSTHGSTTYFRLIGDLERPPRRLTFDGRRRSRNDLLEFS